MYASYEFYTEAFGGSLKKADFRRYELRAEAYIRYLTYVNGDIFATEDDAVKMAVCAAAEVIAVNARKDAETGVEVGRLQKKSEAIDGYSVSYATGDTAEDIEVMLRRLIMEAVEPYLLPTGWLSRVLTEKCHADEC